MGIKKEIYEEFFSKLESKKVPTELIKELKKEFKNEKISEDKILSLIKNEALTNDNN